MPILSHAGVAPHGGLATAEELAAAHAAESRPAPTCPEDYWSPQQADPGAAFIEQYGPIQPVPAHDGTECLKWDDTLWAHADHFKVRAGREEYQYWSTRILHLCWHPL